ncbi:uncharacterized protein STEHIDRAFT_123589, partial [Stereum hirsutum FP-91666 SS1]|uniref:uncharacterized protein n=1 Tax=Stereum hirsutum (strain FP-91666) TaxID=721885 RepID=UPI000444A4DB
MKTLVVLYPNFRSADLDVMDYIDPRSEEEESLTAVRFGQSSIPTELPTKFGEVFVLDVSTALSNTFDLLNIPGSEVSTSMNDAVLGAEDSASIRGLLDKATWNVTLGLGTTLMARSGFPDEYPTMRGLFVGTPAGANLGNIRDK